MKTKIFSIPYIKSKVVLKMILGCLMIICANITYSQDISNGLVAHWPLDNSATDISGNNYKGTLRGPSSAMDRFSNVDGALYFDGLSHVNFGDILDMGLSDMSFSAWVIFEPNTSERVILSKSQHPSDYKVGIGFNNLSPAALLHSPLGQHYLVGNGDVTDQQWHLFTVTMDRDGFQKVYLDGVLNAEMDISASKDVDMQSTYDFIIGAADQGDGAEVYFTGTIDDVRVYDRVLSPEEINNLFGSPDPELPVEPEEGYGNLQLEPGKKYVFACWVSEEVTSDILNFTGTSIKISFDENIAPVVFEPSGQIIDNWQHIVGEFEVPAAATVFNLELLSTVSTGSSYFDDIRIIPVNGSMKSFVYDPQSQRLMAELDENNYATFYEYDQEGGLVRIKKETEKGVYTIQETRSSNAKKF